MNKNGYFAAMWMYIWQNLIKNSVLYKVLTNIYSKISDMWQNSAIPGMFRKKVFSGRAVPNSILGKILFFPFNLLDSIRKKNYEKITAQKEKSLFIRGCKYYLHNILAINIRFIGVFVFTAALCNLIFTFIRGGEILPTVIIMLVGAVMIPVDFNFVDAFKSSIVSGVLEKCLGTDFSYNFYYVTKCGKGARLFCAVIFGVLVGIICGLFSPLYGIVAAGGLWAVFMVLYKVRFGVFVTVFLAPIIPTMAVVGLCLLCLVSLIVEMLTTKKFEWRFEGLGFLIISMAALFLFSSVLSYTPLKSLQIWAVYFVFMIFYFVIINTIKTKKQFFDLLTVFALSSLAVCVYGILQYLFGWNVEQAWLDEEMFEDIKLRIYSTLENPNVLGEYILLALPVCIGLIWTKCKAVSKCFYTVLTGVAGVALVLTFSRGCWVGLMVSAAIFVTFVAGKLWGLLLIAVPALPLVLPASIIERFTSIGDMGDSSTSYRVYIWLGTLLMLKDFWLSGIGLGVPAFDEVYPYYAYPAVTAPHSHNLFLQITVESGIVGLVIFVLLLLVFIKRIAGGYRAAGKGNDMSVMLTAIAAGVIGFLVQGLFDNCFYNNRVFMIFWSFLAIGICGVYIAEEEDCKEEKTNA